MPATSAKITPVITVDGAAVIVAESLTVELPWLVPTAVIVTVMGYVPPAT